MIGLSGLLAGKSPAPARRPASPALDVTVVLLNDGLSSTAVLPLEIFNCAGALWNDLHDLPAEPAFRVTTASLDGKPVRRRYGLELKPTKALADVERADIVIVPHSGLEWSTGLAANSALPSWLGRQYASGAYVAAICSGAAYLAEAGLLDGRIAATHWATHAPFEARYPQVNWRPDLLVTEDSRVLCSGGVYAAIDLSLYLVEKLTGREIAVQCAKALQLPMPGIHGGAYAMLPLSPPHGDDRIRAVEVFLQEAYCDDISTEAMAQRAGLVLRTFTRRFKAATGRHPITYLQAVRIEMAKAKLERDTDPIKAVSLAVGYDDVGFFRRLFKRTTRMTPAEYRARFGPMVLRGPEDRGFLAAPEGPGARGHGT